MLNERHIKFDPFALDLANECLWRGSQAIKLRPKAFAVLEYLLGRPGQLVTKQNLISAVWQDTFVGDAVLKVAIREIREALADDSKSPRFIETAHRRGYRFIGQIGGSAPTEAVAGESAPPRAASPIHRRVVRTFHVDSSDATSRSRGCTAGSRGCVAANARSCS